MRPLHPHSRILLLGLTLLAVLGPGTATATERQPRQMILPPMELDPLDFESTTPLRLRLRTYHLPDDRRAESYELGGWVRVGGSHAARWHLDYAGVESGDSFRYGGGSSGVQWTSRLGGRLSLDVAGRPPLGDESLHPISSRAPSVELRLRGSPLRGERWRVWLGWWAQRVSPPNDSELPDEDFPSGSGVEIAAHGAGASWSWAMHLRRDLAGLPRSTRLDLSADLPLARDLAIGLGAMIAVGPDGDRPWDLGWQLGVSWRPAAEREGDRPRGPGGRSGERPR